ncbi:hypothetical protein [uncultured Methylibium sp.]|uniref:hypothetical protein n=1 Tax=uncultured Methylibium sp. TaxID=381093 RepID=UPI0025F576CF|nr:hypothetical protein [uncultured Methylibium sp.]
MYLVAIAWMYVVLMVAIAEVAHPGGSLLGALMTFVFWGVLPLAVVLYILGSPARRRARRRAEAADAASGGRDPDGRGQSSAVAVPRTVAPEREEP